MLLPMSASLGSCSVAQPGSWCRGCAQALPRAPFRGTRRPRRRPTSSNCCCGKAAPSSTATFTGCPPSRTYELAEDPRTAAGHAVAVCEPAGAEDAAAGKRHSDRHHHLSRRAGRRRPGRHRDDHQYFGRTDGRLLPARGRAQGHRGRSWLAGTASCSPRSGSDNEITLWRGEWQTLTATYGSRPISPPLSSAFPDGTGRRPAPAPAP